MTPDELARLRLEAEAATAREQRLQDPSSVEGRAAALERYARAKADPRARSYASAEEAIEALLAAMPDAGRAGPHTLRVGLHTSVRLSRGSADVEVRGVPWRLREMGPDNVVHLASMLHALDAAASAMVHSARVARLMFWSGARATIAEAMRDVPFAAERGALAILRESWSWTGAHAGASQQVSWARFPWGMFPSDPRAAASVGKSLAEAAQAAMRAELSLCAMCGRACPSSHMFDGVACAGCATLHLGVMY